MVARVLTDVSGIDKEFDYLVPDGASVDVGTEVRIDLSGRRVGGWVTAVGLDPPADMDLRPIAKVRGVGPEPQLVDLARWAAWRWAGRRRSVLMAASPPYAVPHLPAPAWRAPRPPRTEGLTLADPLTILRLPPAADPTPVVAEMAQRGPTLVIVPTADRAAILADRLRRAGGDVALLPAGWRQARAGAAIVIGTRTAAWGPCPGLAGAVILDGHHEALGQEQVPTWHALPVVVERCRRAGVPCLVISACPTVEMLATGTLTTVDRTRERSGWAVTEVVDRRPDDPRLGLYSERLVKLIRSEPRVVCVLNRTGRARLLACAACGELARCETCGAALATDESGQLVCSQCGLRRGAFCTRCGSTRLRQLRIGVTRAREELEALARRPVLEVTAATEAIDPDFGVVVGTEAVLHRLHPADRVGLVAFVDFDQELLAGRVRAADEALSLLALASRLVRGREGRVLVQTRLPEHPVVRAAVHADPALVAADTLPIRQALQLPPFSSVALMSGAGAADFAATLRGRPDSPLSVLGPDGDRWLIKAPDATALADALAAAPRPADPVRVAVEPARM